MMDNLSVLKDHHERVRQSLALLRASSKPMDLKRLEVLEEALQEACDLMTLYNEEIAEILVRVRELADADDRPTTEPEGKEGTT